MHPLIIVQCRYDSSRLPGKALLPLAGEPSLGFLLRRIKTFKGLYDIQCILATTDRTVDDGLVPIAEAVGVPVVRGETRDVLARYCRCLREYPSDAVVRVTADNPLTCPAMLKTGLERFKQTHPDYLTMEGLPYGAGVDIFSSQTLCMLDVKTFEMPEREHINLYILNHPEEFKIDRLTIKDRLCRPDIRISIDTQKDYECVAALFPENEIFPWRIPLETVIRRMDLLSAGKKE